MPLGMRDTPEPVVRILAMSLPTTNGRSTPRPRQSKTAIPGYTDAPMKSEENAS